jgi:uncharacterized alkaline shock family protein YloU
MNMVISEFERTDLGSIQIAPEVIEIIAGLATVEVKGVAGMSGGFVGGIAEMLGKKNLAKGIKVDVGQKEASIDVSVIIEYGFRIPEVAANIQENIKSTIHSMTGLNVVEVNVHILGVEFKSNEEKPEEDQQPIIYPASRVK